MCPHDRLDNSAIETIADQMRLIMKTADFEEASRCVGRLVLMQERLSEVYAEARDMLIPKLRQESVVAK